MRRLTKAQMIEVVKAVGQSIANSAEDIVGDYEHLDAVSLDISVDTCMESFPVLNINREVAPKELFDYVASEKWVIDGREENKNDSKGLH